MEGISTNRIEFPLLKCSRRVNFCPSGLLYRIGEEIEVSAMDEKIDEKKERKGMEQTPWEIRELDALFERVDFSADAPGAQARIWQQIQARLPERGREGYGLESWELEKVVAAGNPYYHSGSPKRNT